MILIDYLKSASKTHLIFDFDETLLKLILPWEKAIGGIEKELASLDEKTRRDYHENRISYSLLQNKYVREFGDKALQLFIKNNVEFETKKLEGIILNKELLNFVKDISGYELFIWSSNTFPTVEKNLKEQGIFCKFKKIVTREDVRFLKPETDGFSLLHDAKTQKEKYLFIGDSINDKMAAEKLGIDFFLIDFFHGKGKIGG